MNTFVTLCGKNIEPQRDTKGNSKYHEGIKIDD
jgi:hypothetical protein